jgi:hypothetical protein
MFLAESRSTVVDLMSDTSDISTAESESEFFERTGPMPMIDENDRVYPRYYFRSCAEVTIYPLDESQPVPVPCFVLTRDLSRDRVSLIHYEQLVPGQRLDVVLNGEAPRPVEVVTCEPWIDGRFAVGCRFLPGASFDAPSAEE